MKTYLLSLLSVLIFLSSHAQTPDPVMPDFQFYKADGSPFNKAQVGSNHKTLFVFFDATCGHCQKTMLQMSKRSAELAGLNLYLVSLDQHITMNYFMDHYGKNLVGKKNVLLLEDRDHVFIPLFKPAKYPALFLYSPKNELSYYTSGDQKLPKLFSEIKK